jgi:hypothetical protein
MTEHKAQHHNSKPITRKKFLPPLQKKIFLYLANYGPKNKNETTEALKSHWRSTWGAFEKLEKKKLIKPVGSKNYQGQEYPRYWATEDGALIALCEGAKAKNVIKRTLEIYPEKTKLHYLLESVSILGTEAFNYGYFAFVSKGKLDQNDLTKMILIQSSLSTERIIKFSILLDKYPEEKQKFYNLATEITDKLKNLVKIIDQSKNRDDKIEESHP